MVLTKRWIRLLGIAAGVLALLLVLTLAGGIYLYNLSRTLPDLSSAPGQLRAARTSIVYAADGSVLTEWHGDQDRKVVTLTSVPRQVQDAVIAAEDPRFYEHDGVDMDAVLSSLGNNRAGAAGSTITQQLVRMLFPEGKRTLTQKVREALMAYELEAKTPKDRVLEAYLNMVYFGDGRYGIESAAHGYFDKSASGLTLPEAALLAGMIDAPSRYSPVTSPSAARARRDEILARMHELSFIRSEDESSARAAQIKTIAPEPPHVAPYFVEYVKQDLLSRLGAQRVYGGGLRVYTTLDPALQAQAEKVVSSVLSRRTDPEAALVSLDPRTGYVVAMIGGRSFRADQFNLAAQGRRQPGSAFKPFLLVAALEHGISPDRKFQTSPISIKVKDGTWRVTNYENEFASGALTLRAATDWSVNAVFARLVMVVGPEKVVDAARRMGITSPMDANPAIALGGLSKGVSPLEMASAYGTLATGGVHVTPTAIVKVTDDSGRTVYAPKPVSRRAVKQAVASRVSGMLHDVVEHGTGLNARMGRWAAGKTGTTQSYRDAWFVGYTGKLSTSVWVGYRKAAVDMTNVHGIKVAGGTFPATIWGLYMFKAISAPTPIAALGSADSTTTATPSGMVRVRLCADTLLLANPRCPRVLTVDLEPGFVPKKVCTKH